MSGSGEGRLEGLCIKASPLGENDRLITILSDDQFSTWQASIVIQSAAIRPKPKLVYAMPKKGIALRFQSNPHCIFDIISISFISIIPLRR